MLERKFLKTNEVLLDTVWHSCDGAGHKVKVIYTDNAEPGWIGYQWEEKGEIRTNEKTAFAFQCRYYLPDETMKIWPKIGDKIKYRGTQPTWFKDLIKNAEDSLKIGEEYTLASLNVNSSWCSVKLKETGDIVYSLSFFEYEEKQTEKELVENLFKKNE